MLFPKGRMRFTSSYQGKSEPDGWIVLELTGAELEGVGKLYLSMEDILNLRQRGDVTTDRLKQARSLLGGNDESGSEE
jgi:hypothetical protein